MHIGKPTTATDQQEPVCIVGIAMVTRDFKQRYCDECFLGMTEQQKSELAVTEFHGICARSTTGEAVLCTGCREQLLFINCWENCVQCLEEYGRSWDLVHSGEVVAVEDNWGITNVWGHLDPVHLGIEEEDLPEPEPDH